MASDFPKSADQMETASTNHLREFPSSYSEPPVLPSSMMVYMNYPSSGSSQQQRTDIPSVEASDNVFQQREGSPGDGFSAWRNATDQVFLMHQVNDPSSIIQQTQNIRGQGLSLSLGAEFSSGLVPNSDSHLMLKSSDDVKQESRTRELEKPCGKEKQNAESTQGDFHCGDQDRAKMDPSPSEISGSTMTIPTSKYLKAVQELLNEVVTAKKVLEQPRSEKMKDIREHGEESKQAGESKDLASAEMQDLQAKQMKLLAMLDEINQRYKQYRNHMQILETSFDSIAGCGAARAYTALALQAMSRHFRCLCDGINSQIRAIQNSLGEQDGNESEGVKIPRLRYVDQQLKQQNFLQELGVLQPHAWRPQRGLPETSVSVLRAWLFEHFLHPYPKDSDKITLARQAGLSRSQVSNWFINARVRLWKPMIEEMYKNEIDSGEMTSPPENATGETESELEASDLQQCASSASKSTDITDFEIQKRDGEETENKDLKFSAEQRYIADDSTYFPGPSLQLGLQQHETFDAATAEASSGTVRFQFLSTEHQQHLFGSSYLLHDFVG